MIEPKDGIRGITIDFRCGGPRGRPTPNQAGRAILRKPRPYIVGTLADAAGE